MVLLCLSFLLWYAFSCLFGSSSVSLVLWLLLGFGELSLLGLGDSSLRGPYLDPDPHLVPSIRGGAGRGGGGNDGGSVGDAAAVA